MPSFILSDEERDEVRAMWRAGRHTLSEIAAEMDASREVITDELVRTGLYTRAGGRGRRGVRKTNLIVESVSPIGTLILSNGERIPSVKGYWKVGDIWRNGV